MAIQLQVTDVVVKKHFKEDLKQLYPEWLLMRNSVLIPTVKIKMNVVAL